MTSKISFFLLQFPGENIFCKVGINFVRIHPWSYLSLEFSLRKKFKLCIKILKHIWKNLGFLFFLRSILVSWVFQVICPFFNKILNLLALNLFIFLIFFVIVPQFLGTFFTHAVVNFWLLFFIYFFAHSC